VKNKINTYTIYDDGGDTEVFERPDGTREKNEFYFSGFGNFIHPYHKKQTEWAAEMLKYADVHLQIREVSTIDDIGEDADSGSFDVKDLRPFKKDKTNCKRHLVFIQDKEMGRGWGVLIEIKPDNKVEILTQDHRDTVRDQTLLDAKWLKEQGITMKRVTVKNIDKILVS
jgi:hypothetical protein